MEPPQHNGTAMSLNPQSQPPANPLWLAAHHFRCSEHGWVRIIRPGRRKEGRGAERDPFHQQIETIISPREIQRTIQISKFNAERQDCPSGDRAVSPSVNGCQPTTGKAPDIPRHNCQLYPGKSRQHVSEDIGCSLGGLLIGAIAPTS